jgi:flagellar hook capping protein FlgD/fibronectin type III domain protein
MREDERRMSVGASPGFRGAWLVGLTLILALAPTAARGQGSPADTVTLTWTAPGDDGPIGTASAYDLRVSTAPIDDANWSAAAVVSGLPAPLPAGTRQSTVVRGLTYGTTYYFAVKTADDAGNWSGLSNVLRWDWVYDTAPPAAPSGLAAVPLSGGGVRASWSPNSEADLAGYTVYRSLGPTGPYTALNGSLLTTPSYEDGTIPAGTAAVWYQVTARDDSGNESARSSAIRVPLSAESGAWTMEPAYPNPSGAGATVRIPLGVPPAGGSPRIEIVNSVGQRVRRIDPGTLPPGTSEIQWDGRNDAGREVAPGAYTAWLVAGPTRIGVRIVRVP